MMRMIQMKPLLYMLGAACLFSFTEITLKILNGSLNCLEVNFSRYILAGIMLLPLALLDLRKRHPVFLESHVCRGYGHGDPGRAAFASSVGGIVL